MAVATVVAVVVVVAVVTVLVAVVDDARIVAMHHCSAWIQYNCCSSWHWIWRLRRRRHWQTERIHGNNYTRYLEISRIGSCVLP